MPDEIRLQYNRGLVSEHRTRCVIDSQCCLSTVSPHQHFTAQHFTAQHSTTAVKATSPTDTVLVDENPCFSIKPRLLRRGKFS